MKEKWTAPEVIELSINATANNFWEGEIPDGDYMPEQFCGAELYS